MNPIHVGLLRQQMSCDTLWCFECGLSGFPHRADVRYTVANGDLSASVLACRACLHRALKTPGINVVTSEPVTQPAYIALLEAALADDSATIPSAQDMWTRTTRPLIADSPR